MNALPAGTILQLMYFSERLETLPPGRFIEIGAWNGEITSFLLSRGWIGSVYEFDVDTTARLKHRIADEIVEGRLALISSDYVRSKTADVDIVISAMIMEHLSDEDEAHVMQNSHWTLEHKSGTLIGIVPASPRYWGIEDDNAGSPIYARSDRSYHTGVGLVATAPQRPNVPRFQRGKSQHIETGADQRIRSAKRQIEDYFSVDFLVNSQSAQDVSTAPPTEDAGVNRQVARSLF